MLKKSVTFLAALFVLLQNCSSVFAVKPLKNIVCYHGTWSTYRPSFGQFNISNIDPFQCTHLIYAFFGIHETGELRMIDPYLDLEENGGRGNIKKFNALKLLNPTLKTLAAVGGWNEGSKNFSIVAAQEETRSRFIQSVIQFLQRHGFDGLDLDWEYPGQRHSLQNNNDKENYIKLLSELKESFAPFGFMLSAAVGSTKFSADLSYDIPKVVQYLDLFNVMAYDLHGPWDNVTGLNSPLYAGLEDVTARAQQLNVDDIVKYWLSKGAPKDKLVLGLPFYGRSFTLENENSHTPGSPHIGRGLAGPYSLEPGVIGYNELCEKMLHEHWNQNWDIKQQVPYAYKGRQWVSYESPRSIALKAEYVVNHDLAGIMVWSLESDDFHGICGEKRPLLKQINRILFGSNSPTNLAPISSNGSNELTAIEYVCPGNVGYVRDPKKCSKFYFCNAGATYPFQCPENLFFDVNVMSCNYAKLVKC